MYIDGVFSGGGIKGYSLIGAYQVLEEKGYVMQRCAGTSAGSIIAAFILAGYTGEEMERIFLMQCRSNGYQVSDDALALLRSHFAKLYETRDDNFGNGRDVRNIFEKIINAQADRLAADDDLTDDELVQLTIDDVRLVCEV